MESSRHCFNLPRTLWWWLILIPLNDPRGPSLSPLLNDCWGWQPCTNAKSSKRHLYRRLKETTQNAKTNDVSSPINSQSKIYQICWSSAKPNLLPRVSSYQIFRQTPLKEDYGRRQVVLRCLDVRCLRPDLRTCNGFWSPLYVRSSNLSLTKDVWQ